MSLRVGCDLDGVLADMDAELLRHAEGLFGESVARRSEEGAPEADPPTPREGDDVRQAAAEAAPENTQTVARLKLSARQQRRLWRHVESIENFWESLAEMEPGIVSRLAAVAGERRWEVIFLTKRPETAGATAQAQSQRWLQSRGFAMPSVFVVQGSRGRIAAALDLDVVIDDRPENCVDVVADSSARAMLVVRDEEGIVPPVARRLGIAVVKSVDECLALLVKLDTDEPESVSLVDRFKRLLAGRS